MFNRLSTLVACYSGLVSKLYVILKYIITPFSIINSSLPIKGRIIDVGCGKGIYSLFLYLKSPSRELLGVDNNREMIVYAKNASKALKKIDFSFMDLNKEYSLPFANAYLINDVLHHIPYKSQKKLLNQIYNVIDENGILVIKDVHDENKLKFFLNYLVDKMMTGNQKLYYKKKKELISLLKKIGFKVRYEKIDYYPFPHIIYICIRKH
jgi:uncharacterized protein